MTFTMTKPEMDYAFLIKLEKLYLSPWDLITNFRLPWYKKRERLVRWYNARLHYIFENGRDCDFQIDKTLCELEQIIEMIKGIERTIEGHVKKHVKEIAVVLS